jgi:rhodanese-related sulfurtransferase
MNDALKIFSLVLMLLLGACESRSGKVTSLSPNEAYGMQRNDFAVIVDVREKDEIQQTGMVAGARSMPLSQLGERSPEWPQFVSSLPKDKQIILYCRSGNCSGEIAERLAREGFRVGNMGGFEEWKRQGLPVSR